jgi:hypothetical protein
MVGVDMEVGLDMEVVHFSAGTGHLAKFAKRLAQYPEVLGLNPFPDAHNMPSKPAIGGLK